jgi:hypothetical protein
VLGSSSPSPRKSISAIITPASASVTRKRLTLASSQRRPLSILIWLPTWPDMATQGSGSSASSLRRWPMISMLAPLPAISTTWPMASCLATSLRLAGRCAAGFDGGSSDGKGKL